MKIRFAFVAAMLAATAACSSNSPTAVDQRAPRSAAPLHDEAPPPLPDTTINRGGGAAGSGN